LMWNGIQTQYIGNQINGFKNMK